MGCLIACNMSRFPVTNFDFVKILKDQTGVDLCAEGGEKQIHRANRINQFTKNRKYSKTNSSPTLIANVRYTRNSSIMRDVQNLNTCMKHECQLATQKVK